MSYSLCTMVRALSSALGAHRGVPGEWARSPLLSRCTMLAMTITISLMLCVAVMLVGLLLWWLSAHGQRVSAFIGEVGRVMFACGLLVTLLRYGGSVLLHG